MKYVVLVLVVVGGAIAYFLLHPSTPKVEITSSQVVAPAQRLEEIYQAESKRIGAKDPDPALTEKRLTEVAERLSLEEIHWLEAKALNSKEQIDGRAFATYLLGLRGKGDSAESLGRLALAEIPKKSEKMERELKMQAVAGLARVCTKVTEARDGLLDVVEKQADELLRERAHRALAGCKVKP